MALKTMAAGLSKGWLRLDPLHAFRFHVEIDGLLFAGFSEVSGLSVEIETETYNEGGENEYVHILPKSVKYDNIVLKHGILYSDQMWRWIQGIINGRIRKRDGRILLLGTNGLPMWYWSIHSAYPVKWTGSDLNATSSEVFVETLELAHHGIRKSSAALAVLSSLIP